MIFSTSCSVIVIMPASGPAPRASDLLKCLSKIGIIGPRSVAGQEVNDQRQRSRLRLSGLDQLAVILAEPIAGIHASISMARSASSWANSLAVGSCSVSL